MAVVSAQESTSAMPPRPFHVFLSFRGEDNRMTFTDHLYAALLRAGFRTFRDNEGLARGKNIKSELERAISQARCSIIVLSENYASSGWCLDELVAILRCRETSKHEVIPVFYHVDPSDVRKQRGSFAEAFELHEKKKEVMEKVEAWRAALREVADLAGMPLQNNEHESEFIKKIVKFTAKQLNRKILSVPNYLIGKEFLNVNSWFPSDSTDARIAALWGMGGTGKTTIAKCIFNLKFESFEGSSFLFNIRKRSKETDGLIRLQECLLSDFFTGIKERISSVDEGIIKIKDALCCKRVLIVLDDVDEAAQLDKLIGAGDWLCQGSKIIITTRNKQLLQGREVYKIHIIGKLDDKDSLELFSWHAFGQDHPYEGYLELSEKVVNHCEGIPLALEVLGSSLNGERVDVWESEIQKLKEIPDSRIMNKLKISYDSLQDDHDRNLFLDIACFFVGEDKNHVITILKECNFYAEVGIQSLMHRCLLTVNKDNRLMMHQLLQNMGREIVRLESPKEPGRRSRLWSDTDSLDVLKEKTGTKKIEGLVLNSQMCNNKEMGLKTKAFARMRKLRLLKINNFQLTGGYKKFPKKLRCLSWSGFHLESIPSKFPLERLVALDMCNSKLKQVWEGTKVLECLKILNLSHSHALTRTPDFSGLPNLEKLILRDCISLVEVHESIGNLETKLVLLNLQDCKELKKLPREISMLTVLETLDISGCSNLKELPTNLLRLKSLTIHTGGSFSFTLLSESLEILTLAGGNLSDDAFTKEFSCIFPGRNVPSRFHPKVAGSSLSFTMPSSPPNPRFRAMNVCCVFAFNQQLWTPKDLFKLGIENKTIGWTSFHLPNSCGFHEADEDMICCEFPEADEDMIWLSHWKFVTHEMKPGDELFVGVSTMNDVFKVKEIGIQLVYEEQEEKGNQSKNQVVIEELNIPTDPTGIARLFRDCGIILRTIGLFPLSICSSFGSKSHPHSAPMINISQKTP